MSSAERRRAARRLVAGALALLGLSAAGANPDLARSQGCMGCHGVDQKVLGPSFVEVAKRYGAEPGAADKLAKRIASGSTGVWGPVGMPAQPQLSADEAAALARWVLAGAKPS
jgi:cytochrome c